MNIYDLVEKINYLVEREKDINTIPVDAELELRRLLRGIRNLISTFESQNDEE